MENQLVTLASMTAWLGSFSLDLKLGVRMLLRYPGLTLVGGAAMAFGIAAGVAAFELRTQWLDPVLPLDEGSRIVGLRKWNASENRPVPPTVDDFAAWRERLTLIEDVSAFRLFSRNLMTGDGRSEAEAVAAMSASGFRVARVPARLGRTLVESDERPGAAPVIVIGDEMWKTRFAADPSVVGRTVRLGSEHATVVGVMPAGFAFPAAHGLWVPLQDQVAGAQRAEGAGLQVFGRIAPGAAKAQAQAELSAVGLHAAAGSAERDERLVPQLIPFAWLVFDPSGVWLGVALGNTFVVMLLVLVSANVALLMFARAATREREIVVRSALGASRARIVGQLFVEALVLAGLAVGVGLAAARFGLGSFLTMYQMDSGRRLPFWMDDSLTPTTVIYAGALTMATAAMIGVFPALRTTGRGQQDRLRQSSAGGGGLRFGGVWTVVIASQVAATLTFPAAAFFFHRWVVGGQTRDVGFSSNRFLSARLELDRESPSGVPAQSSEPVFRARLHDVYAELERRVAAEPEAAGVTFADRLPGTLHARWWIEADGEAPPPASALGHRVSSASVALNFFDVLGAPILAGRAFTPADLDAASGVVIVNQSFVTQVLGGQNPVGRRIRRGPLEAGGQPGPWFEIVGLVRDLGMVDEEDGLYHPVSPEKASALRLAIGVKGNPESFTPRLRAVAAEVEPALQIHDLMPLNAVGADQWLESQYLSRVLAVLSAIALLLSLTAIYSVMSFAVTQRTREIGIRMALGANRRTVIGLILRRPLTQVTLGVVAGAILVAVFFVGLFEDTPTVSEAALITAYALLMMSVCLLAAVVPARRALRVDPARVLAVDV